jgi:hypothetical protein
VESRLDTTLNEFGVVSNDERAVLRSSLLKLKSLKQSKGVRYSPKDERTAALLTVYRHFATAE